MRIGIKFPTREIGTDRSVLRDWAVSAGELGFSHVVLIDHVLGVDAEVHPDYGAQFPAEGRRPPYGLHDEFHEPLTTLAYIGALAPHIELTTGVVIAPQRQTALLAKQAAQIDIFSGGSTRLCLGVGWNPVEYRALGMDFHTRGRRIEAQVETLRALWTLESVSIENEFECITGAGLAPDPIQRPIPIWLGGWSLKAKQRVGRIADGWYYGHDHPPHLEGDLDLIRRSCEAAGRDPEALGLEGAVELRYGMDGLEDRADAWARHGATHLNIDPQIAGLRPRDHVDVLEELAARLQPAAA